MKLVFSVAFNNIRGHATNQNGRNSLWTGKSIFLLWTLENVPQRLCEVFTLKTFKSHLEMVLGNLLYVTLIQQGELTRWSAEIPSNLSNSAILWIREEILPRFKNVWVNSKNHR